MYTPAIIENIRKATIKNIVLELKPVPMLVIRDKTPLGSAPAPIGILISALFKFTSLFIIYMKE
jgi:hypothetical protein